MTKKLNIFTTVNIYSDSSITNNPLQNNVNWTNNAQGIEVNEPESKNITVYPGQTETLFSGVVATAVDNTTTFNLEINPEISNTYKLSHEDGTAPAFRVARSLAADATTQITVTVSGSLAILSHTAGTAPNLASVVVGDNIRLGAGFGESNRGVFSVIQKTSSSLTIVNSKAVGEVVVLGADFADDLMVYSSNGVQIGQKVKISEGFSVYSNGTYEIVDVAPSYLIFASTKGLPEELDILSEVVIFSNSKSFIYIEADRDCSVTFDGIAQGLIKPLKFGVGTTNSIRSKPGIYMRTGDVYSATIKNESEYAANILVISAE